MNIDTSIHRLFALLTSVPRDAGEPLPTSQQALVRAEAADGLVQERWLEIAAILEARGK